MLANSTLSVSSCWITRRRVAPSAVRTLISALRPMPRTSSRFAIFAHAISSTTPEIHISRCRFDPYCSCMFWMPPPPAVNTTCTFGSFALFSAFANLAVSANDCLTRALTFACNAGSEMPGFTRPII